MEPCESYAPGRSLPNDVCVHCARWRHEHLPGNRSTPRQNIPASETTVAAITQEPAAPTFTPVYCRQCNTGMIIKSQIIDPDTYPCPRCGHVGPKTQTPTSKAIGIPPEHEALAKEHEAQVKTDTIESLPISTEG